MFGAGRAIARLFLFVATAILMAQGPSTTTITGIVYRADGTPAGGTLLISWPAFTTNAGQAVAAGTKSVLVGNAGALSVGLAPNAGATPANMVYTIVYQLDDGTVKTEYWSVPTSSPTTIANVRTILGSGGSAAAPVSKQYVDTALAGKADDNSVVHRSGTETISGAKQFTASPQFPCPGTSKRCGEQSICGLGGDYHRKRVVRQQSRRQHERASAITGRSGVLQSSIHQALRR
jgi:trimeric autotransporter adhesin